MDTDALAAGIVLLIPVFLILTLVGLVLLFRKWREEVRTRKELEKRLEPIRSLDDEIANLNGQIEKQRTVLGAEKADKENEIQTLRATYAEKRVYLDEILKRVAIYDEKLELGELGIYEPHFDFDDSEAFKQAIKDNREKQKKLVKDKRAVGANNGWTVDGSAAKGRTMINRQIRLTLRAFNNECAAAIANVRWNNVDTMEARIEKAAEQIDKLNESMSIKISDEYILAKLSELHLTHEYREKQKEEKEERAEMRAADREEKRLEAEARRAEKEEQKYQKLLEKARQEAGADGGTEELKAKIAALEADLAEAHEVVERAHAMAELTKCGYVYVISNVGSFGDEIVKIGMTRRLDPNDRVKELGDASVPFTFDTHAMIYSDDAPGLETALHQEFAEQRVNMANFRKEFFRVSLDQVEDAVGRLAPDASFFKDREAQEWHETLARRKEALTASAENITADLPDAI